jgi:hypothetical protein
LTERKYPDTVPPDRPARAEVSSDAPLRLVVAKAIYDVVFLPGEYDGCAEPMPSFEEAEAMDLGAYDRACRAADRVLTLVLPKSHVAPR